MSSSQHSEYRQQVRTTCQALSDQALEYQLGLGRGGIDGEELQREYLRRSRPALLDTSNPLEASIARAREDERLLRYYEGACALAARQYADGCDTTSIDAEVDLLLAELRERGLA